MAGDWVAQEDAPLEWSGVGRPPKGPALPGWGRGLPVLVGLWMGLGCVPADRKNELSSIPIGGPTTIYDVHTSVVDSGSEVELVDVVAVLPRPPTADWFLVQDPRGGEYAGLEVNLQHALPHVDIAAGDTLTLRGILVSRSGRTSMVITDADAIERTGTTELVPTSVGQIADWSPYNGVLVAPGPTEVLDCGDAAGQPTTNRDLSIDFTHIPVPVAMGTGEIEAGLVGALHGVPEAWSLSPRTPAELGTAPQTGCPTTIEAARTAVEAPGRLVLPEVRVTAVQPDGRRVFVQDLSGGPNAGLELTTDVHSADELQLNTLQPGDHIAVWGLPDAIDGPLQLRTLQWTPAADATPPVFDTPEDPFHTAWDGALVELAALTLTGPTTTGRVGTDAGLELVDVLLDDDILPTEGSVTVRGALRVDPRTDPAGVQLLPRSAADWSAAP